MESNSRGRRHMHVYENSEAFLKRLSSDPFGAEFEKSLEDAPVVEAAKVEAAAAASEALMRQCSISSGTSSSSSSNPAPFAAPPKQSSRISGRIGGRKSAKSASSYDEMSLNSGRPVIVNKNPDCTSDSLTAVNFASPLRDVVPPPSSSRPVPAPRLSKLPSMTTTTDLGACDEQSEDEDAVIYEELGPPPPPPTEASNENLYSEPKGGGGDHTVDSFTNLLDRSNEELIGGDVEDLEEEERDELADLPDRVDGGGGGGAAGLLNPKLTTIDIRQDVNKLWEKAVQELDRDEQLVKFMVEKEQKQGAGRQRAFSANSYYDSVAIPEARFRIVNGVQVPVPVTLLEDFDPMFHKEKKSEEEEEEEDKERRGSDSNSPSSSSLSSSSEDEDEEHRTVFAPVPSPRKRNREAAESSSSAAAASSRSTSKDDVFPAEDEFRERPSRRPKPRSSYENVWIPPREKEGDDEEEEEEEASTPEVSTASSSCRSSLNHEDKPLPSASVPPTLPRRNTSGANENLYSTIDGASALPPAARRELDDLKEKDDDEDDDDDIDTAKKSAVSNFLGGGGGAIARSSSTSNLAVKSIAKKFSFGKIGRRISDLQANSLSKKHIGDEADGSAISISKPPSAPLTPNPPSSMTSSTRRRSSSLLETSWPGTRSHSGPLFVYSKSKRKTPQYGEKWCVLSNANLRYFNARDSMADPKEMILLRDVLSINKRETVRNNDENSSENEKALYLFDVAFLPSKDGRGVGGKKAEKLAIRTFCSESQSVRDTWIDKMSQSLSHKLDSFSMSHGDCSKLGWVHLKVGFAGTWHQSWISLRGATDFCYTLSDPDSTTATAAGVGGDHEEERVDLKKTKNVTLVTDIKNLSAPEAAVPVIVVDLIDRSLYIQSRSEKETLHWKVMLESVAFNNSGGMLSELQLTRDDIPVIVEQCVNFVFRHGCMTEGIYRHSGVKTKIDRLLREFSCNAWAVQLTREAFSEHDVANALKRFMRTLREPLLTGQGHKGRQRWMGVSRLAGEREKMKGYSVLLSELPGINRRTLSRIIGHLRAIARQSERNLMPNYNLAAIWGPTLLTVDGQSASDFARTSAEADVCKDLIDNYRDLFNVTKEELDREEAIMRKTENFNRNPNPVKISGEVMMFVHIDTKTGDDCVSIAVTPKMTARELQRRALKKARAANYTGDASRFVLHEVVLGGELERPIHHSELIYDVTLKWSTWAEGDRRNTYLLLKRNTFFEEAVPEAVPPISIFGEAYYGSPSSRGDFKRCLFSVNNARITRSKEGKKGTGLSVEVESWDIEKIIWYFGCEKKRQPQPPYNLNITFIQKDQGVVRNKDRPHFGRTISFENRELFIRWVAAMLVAEHQTDILPPDTLLNIEDD